MAEQTHWKKLTDTNFLGSWDVTNGSIIVTIRRVEQKKVFNQTKQKDEACVVAEFTDDRYKPMIMNKTNCKTLQKLTGSPFIETWADYRIEIKTEKVKAFGEVVDALRVCETAPAPATKAATPKTEAPIIDPCTDCGAVVTEFGGYSPLQVAQSTKSRYGRVLCAECSKKERAKTESEVKE